MNDSPQEAPPPPEASAVKQAVDWAAKHWVRVRLAHEGMMLEKIQRQNRIVEIDARNAMTGKVGDVTDFPSSKGKGNEMGVDIGDTIHNHFHPPPPAQQSPPPLPSSQPKSKLPSLLVRTAAVGVLLASGAGGGAAILGLLGAFDKPPPPAVIDYTDGYMEVDKYVPEQGGGE